MSGNTQGGVRVSMIAEWRAYDSLPRPIREIYARAPFDYAVSRAARDIREQLAGGASVADIRRRKIRAMAAQLMAEARKTYGPDHPDAQRSRLEGRA